jgi:aminoglycoside N3'-acetyltransferase
MNELQARDALMQLFDQLEVQKGQLLYLTVDMSRIPLPAYPVKLSAVAYRKRQQKWCHFLLKSIKERIGEEGTLIMHSFSYRYAGGQPFVLEETPSEVGPFTEFLLRQPKCIRSLHPMFSCCGIGPLAKLVLEGCGKSGFGPTSPFQRLHDLGAYFVALGTTIGKSMTYLHHLEQLYGVTHRFNKPFDHEVWRDGSQIEGPWLCNLRFRSVPVGPGLVHCERALDATGGLKVVEGGNMINQAIDLKLVNAPVFELLAEDSGCMMEESVTVCLDEETVDLKSKNRYRFKLHVNEVIQ